MTASFYNELIPVLEAVTVLSPSTFCFGNEPPVEVGIAAWPSGSNGSAAAGDPLVNAVVGVLYDRCYSQPGGVNGSADPDPQFVSRLSRTNRGQDHWDTGWTVYQVFPDGQLGVLKGERQRVAVPGEYITLGPPGLVPQTGGQVMLRVVRESLLSQPGFYFMFGETPSDVWDDHYLVRFYFHCTPEAAELLVDYLTASLNRFQIPYRMKVLSDAAHCTRTDAMVLYCARRYYSCVARIVSYMPQRVSSALRASVPLFSKAIRPGVGVAEDPNTGESFGMHRCRLTAQGIIDSWLQGDQSTPGRLRAVAVRFASDGLMLERPYLNPGSFDLYEAVESLQ